MHNYIRMRPIYKRFNKIGCIIVIFILYLFKLIYSTGLPGEYLLSDQWRLFLRQYSPLYNPSIITEESYLSFHGVMSAASDETSTLWLTGFTKPIGLYRSVAFSFIGENGRDVYNTGEGFITGEPQSLTTSSNDNYAAVLSYGVNLFGRLSTGLNLKLLNQGNFGESKIGFCTDIGLHYRLTLHPLLGYHRAGLAIHNIFSQSTCKYEAMHYPLNMIFTYHGEFFNRFFLFDADFYIRDFNTSPNMFSSEVYSEKGLALVGSIKLLPFIYICGSIDFINLFKVNQWGIATNLSVPQLNNGRDMSITYHYRNYTNSLVQGSHSIYFKIDFGAHREEIYARRIGLKVNINANKLYNDAMKYYFNGQYWESFFTFKQLQLDFPDFYKNDNASYYSALCLENMDFRSASKQIFLSTISKYPKSKIVYPSHLGLMRLNYRNEDFNEVRSQFAILNKNEVNDSIKKHAFYIMGQTELLDDAIKSMQYLSAIDELHPDYIFAQFSLSVANAMISDSSEYIIEGLQNCINSNITTTEQEEIRNKALVHIGYLYYEENLLSKAIVALKMVPEKSLYFTDALIGIGWTAIKARQWKNCIDAGFTLSRLSNNIYKQCEGALIQAYGYMMTNQYENAINTLKPFYEKFDKFEEISEDSLYYRNFLNDNNWLSYNRLSESLLDSNIIAGKSNGFLDSLHKKQIAIKLQIDNYINFQNEMKRFNYHKKSLENLKEDIEFTLTKLGKILMTSDSDKIIKKFTDKDKELSKELEALKAQMKEFEVKTK